MDIFTEQLVIKPSTGKDTALKALIIIAAVAVSAISLFLALCGLGFLLLLGAGAIYGAYYLITGFNVEYEYIVTNGEMDVDKIIAKRKRKRLVTVKASAFERFGKLENAPEPESNVTIIQATGYNAGKEDTVDYYADLTHASYGSIRVIISAEEKVVETLKPFLSRNARIAFDKEQKGLNY